MSKPIARAEWWGQMHESKIIKRDESAEIAQQTAEFLARGGKINSDEEKPKETVQNQHNIQPQHATQKRGNKEAMKTVQQKQASKARTRMTQNHMAIMLGIEDLQRRGIKTNMVSLLRETGQYRKSLDERLTALILNNFVTESECKQYTLTEAGRNFVYSGSAGK